jgi:hypothetical protein
VLSVGPPKYPSSAPKARDWDRVVGDITKQEGDENPEGDAALNALFQKIYSQGSDEVKRAMNKSFVSSGFHCVKNSCVLYRTSNQRCVVFFTMRPNLYTQFSSFLVYLTVIFQIPQKKQLLPVSRYYSSFVWSG